MIKAMNQNKIIAVINNKGGVGKTTTAVNTAALLTHQGYRVLLIDMDSQASASLAVGISWDHISPSLADVIQNNFPIRSAIHKTYLSGLDVIPGDMNLASTDVLLADMPGREHILGKHIRTIQNDYDFIVCDCPPSLSLLPINALVCADYYLVPVTPEYLALEGLIGLQQAIRKLCIGMGLKIELLGILITMVQTWSRSQKQVIKLIRSHYTSQVFTTTIPREQNICIAPSYGCDIFSFKKKSKGSKRYAQMGSEIIKRFDIR